MKKENAECIFNIKNATNSVIGTQSNAILNIGSTIRQIDRDGNQLTGVMDANEMIQILKREINSPAYSTTELSIGIKGTSVPKELSANSRKQM